MTPVLLREQKIYLSLGSNIEPRLDYLHQASLELKRLFPHNFCISPLYQTKPYGGLHQGAYLNACVGFAAALTPEEILEKILEVETRLGRKRQGGKWEAREIDIDLLLVGNQTWQSPRLTLPHYDLLQRDFFLLPLLDLDPHLCHPGTGLPLAQALKNLPLALSTQPEIWQAPLDRTQLQTA